MGQELCTEGRLYCQNEPSLSIDVISDKKDISREICYLSYCLHYHHHENHPKYLSS